MTQHVGYLLERRSSCKQASGHRVTQQMRSRVWKPSSTVGLTDGLTDQIRTRRLVPWRSVTHEDRTIGCLSPHVRLFVAPEIVDNPHRSDTP
jgi:hypothetical protein